MVVVQLLRHRHEDAEGAVDVALESFPEEEDMVVVQVPQA